jgi:hypothetical protein
MVGKPTVRNILSLQEFASIDRADILTKYRDREDRWAAGFLQIPGTVQRRPLFAQLPPSEQDRPEQDRGRAEGRRALACAAEGRGSEAAYNPDQVTAIFGGGSSR